MIIYPSGESTILTGPDTVTAIRRSDGMKLNEWFVHPLTPIDVPAYRNADYIRKDCFGNIINKTIVNELGQIIRFDNTLFNKNAKNT